MALDFVGHAAAHMIVSPKAHNSRSQREIDGKHMWEWTVQMIQRPGAGGVVANDCIVVF